MKIFLKILYGLSALALVAAGCMALAYGITQGAMPVTLGVLMLLLLPVGWLLKKYAPRLHTALSRAVSALFLAALLITLIASAQILSCYWDDEDVPEDAVMLVLGCGLSRADGISPSLVMLRRLSAAQAYLSAHPETKCVLSGGQGPDEQITEAKAMYDHLVSRGIDPARLYKEESSTTTQENIAFSKALMLEEGLIPPEDTQHLIIVTDGFHEFRAQHIGRASGFTPYTVASRAPFGIVALYWLREIPGIVSQVWLAP